MNTRAAQQSTTRASGSVGVGNAARFALLALCVLFTSACGTKLHAMHAGTATKPSVEKLYVGIANVYVV